MATESWPNDLPQKQFLDIKDKRQKGTIRTEMDTGPKKVRKRFSAAVRRVSVKMILDGDQKNSFDDFFIDTLDEGAKKFDWEDPSDDTTVEMRFISYPGFKQKKGAKNISDRVWEGTLKLEILPS